MSALITWQRITEPYLYGYRATCGTYSVEIIRHYASEWHVYAYIAGVMLRSKDNRGTSYAGARAAAARWLRQVTHNKGGSTWKR